MYKQIARNCETVLKQNLPSYFRRCQSVSPVGPMQTCVGSYAASAKKDVQANYSVRPTTSTTNNSKNRPSVSHSALGLGLLNRSVMPMVQSSSCVCTISSEASSFATKIDQKTQVHFQGQITRAYGCASFGRNAWNRHFQWDDRRPSCSNVRKFHITGLVSYTAKTEGSQNDPVQIQDKANDSSTKGSATESGTSTGNMRVIAPSNFDKKILVWTGKYPSIEAVPTLVSDSTLNWAKNKFRVYVNIAMAVGTFCTALVVMVIGRRRAERGESVSKMNMMRHPQQYQQHLTDEETSARSK